MDGYVAAGLESLQRQQDQAKSKSFTDQQKPDAGSTSPPPIKPLHELEISKNPFLNSGDAEGWITIAGHLVYLSWSKYISIPAGKTYKESMEKLVAEAALMQKQTQVEIRSDVHKRSNVGTKEFPQWIQHDRHITVYFPKSQRKAHIYVGPHGERNVKNIKIWRREEKPKIVLC
ncbi:uncharacterized protein LY89DRAFT_736010 [Mollisia scopiformis]|uniref:Uncharacterized protein n=1 Tax=Mollisia scopiformis TaxID=149040 RepID=A0A194X571_MOLSC|nr:uncharacterized protein LY89DRAFT_736010 [Mollisia scopiformis]KUJ14952.1 hypothetical protein LY89DRAFT_736010 [Mollisia scopiformis]